MIELKDASVAIGGKPIVSDVAMTLRPGEVAAVVGPNGSGKTTLLRAICGDLSYKGSITIHGAEVSRLAPARAATMRAVLPQAASLAFPYTVREVVRLGIVGGRTGKTPEAADRLPDQALVRVDLEGFAGRFYQELSGGEQQRVQLARVLCQVWTPVLDGVPRYLFLDEPVSSLDIRHQLAVMEVAKDFARRGGGVIAVLHDLNLTAMFADKVLVMHRGRLAAAGDPASVLTDELLGEVFQCRLKVGSLPPAGVPFVLPQTATL